MGIFRKPICVIAAATLIMTGCSQSQTVESIETNLKVNTVAPQKGVIERETAFTGRVMPDGAVFVIPKLQGEITAVNFNVGDTVKKGDVLFEIDDTIDQLQLQQAQSGLEAAKAGLAQATGATFDAQMVQMEGQLKQAQSSKKWTEDTYDIYDDSYEANSNNIRAKVKMAEEAMKAAKAAMDADPTNGDKVQAYEKAKIAYSGAQNAYDDFTGGYETQYNQLTQGLEQTEIGLDMLEKAYDLAKGPAHQEQITMIESQLDQAQAGYEMALKKLSYSKVTAPIDGVIQQKNVAVHGFASQSEPAFVISDQGALAVTFSVSADAAANLQVGDIATVHSGNKTYSAPIVEVATMLDQASGLFKVKAQINEEAPELLSGVAVKLTAITAKSENTTLIPAGAVYYDDGKPYVYLAVDGVAVKTLVETGLINDENAEITKGINSDSKVITSWSPHLIDGALIDLLEV